MKATLLHCWWEYKSVHPLGRTVWRFIKTVNIEVPCDPAIPILGLDPEKTVVLKDTCTPTIMAALCTIAKTWKQPKCIRTDECIMKIGYIYTME